MRIDLHTHSSRSDGTLTPTELVEHAQQVGLDVVALTDHDSFEGWAEAESAARDADLTVVRGIEVSCRWRGEGVHLLGYEPDPAYPPLVAELHRVRAGRDTRLPAVLDRLRELGIDIGEEDVRRAAGDAAAIGRPHVADALVALGVVADRDEAFERFLGAGRPAYVDRYAADLEEMIALIVAAGGAAVVAHPWSGRYGTTALDRDGLASLQAGGLAGIEVGHQDHDERERGELAAIAAGLGLVATGSSDFHGTGKVGFELGCHTTEPVEYERLLALLAPA